MSLILNNVPIPVSPERLHFIARLIRNKKLSDSLNILMFTPNKGGWILYKIFKGVEKSLIKENETSTDFFITKLEVQSAPVLKRIMFRAKGMSSRLRKRSSTINCFITKQAWLNQK